MTTRARWLGATLTLAVAVVAASTLPEPAVPTTGRVWLEGADVTRAGARRIAAQGVGHIPEDRLHAGMAPALSLLIGSKRSSAPRAAPNAPLAAAASQAQAVQAPVSAPAPWKKLRRESMIDNS